MPWIVCKCGHDMEVEGETAKCPMCGWLCTSVSTWAEGSFVDTKGDAPRIPGCVPPNEAPSL